MATAAWAVGLRDYGGDLDVGLREEVDEGGDGEVWGAAEDDAHWLFRGESGGDRAECFAVEILGSWGAAVLRPYVGHATTRLVFLAS